MEYKPFGDTKIETGSLALNKKFTGKELDDSTGLYDYNARMYDAKLGRFISADTLIPDLNNPQSLNRYSYCLNNPLKYIDPSGHYEVSVDELQPGDIGLQRVPTNALSTLVKPAIVNNKQAPYAHGIVVLEVHENKKGQINLLVGSMRNNPRIELLKESRSNMISGEMVSDYDFFRVTNDPKESMGAVYKAKVLGSIPANKSELKWDPKGLLGALVGKDWTKNEDNKVLCTEYLNLLYNNKFHDPQKGVATPNHIYEYQEKIKRPN